MSLPAVFGTLFPLAAGEHDYDVVSDLYLHPHWQYLYLSSGSENRKKI